MAPHSSIFAWRVPWTEEPGRLQSINSPGHKESGSTEQHFDFPSLFLEASLAAGSLSLVR